MRDGSSRGRRQAKRFLQDRFELRRRIPEAEQVQLGQLLAREPHPLGHVLAAVRVVGERRFEPSRMQRAQEGRELERDLQARSSSSSATPASTPGISSAPKNGQAYSSVGSPTKAGAGTGSGSCGASFGSAAISRSRPGIATARRGKRKA